MAAHTIIFRLRMEINKKSFVEYIVRNSEQEGHFKYFEDRARLWTALKQDKDNLQSLVFTLLTVRKMGL